MILHVLQTNFIRGREGHNWIILCTRMYNINLQIEIPTQNTNMLMFIRLAEKYQNLYTMNKIAIVAAFPNAKSRQPYPSEHQAYLHKFNAHIHLPERSSVSPEDPFHTQNWKHVRHHGTVLILTA